MMDEKEKTGIAKASLLRAATEPITDMEQDQESQIFKPIDTKPRGPRDIIYAAEKNRAEAFIAVDEDIYKTKNIRMGPKKMRRGLKVTCKQKCFLCCTTLVPIMYGEDAMMITELIKQGEFPAIFSAAGMLNQAYTDAGVYDSWEEGKLTEAAQKVFGLKMHCPLLDKESKTCMIYGRRPITCFSKIMLKHTKGEGKKLSARRMCKNLIRQSKGLVTHLMPTRSIRGASDLEIRKEALKAFKPLPQLLYNTMNKISPLSDEDKLSALGMSIPAPIKKDEALKETETAPAENPSGDIGESKNENRTT